MSIHQIELKYDNNTVFEGSESSILSFPVPHNIKEIEVILICSIDIMSKKAIFDNVFADLLEGMNENSPQYLQTIQSIMRSDMSSLHKLKQITIVSVITIKDIIKTVFNELMNIRFLVKEGQAIEKPNNQILNEVIALLKYRLVELFKQYGSFFGSLLRFLSEKLYMRSTAESLKNHNEMYISINLTNAPIILTKIVFTILITIFIAFGLYWFFDKYVQQFIENDYPLK